MFFEVSLNWNVFSFMEKLTLYDHLSKTIQCSLKHGLKW